MSDFESNLINGLNQAITPANGVLQQAEIQLTSPAIANAFVSETISKNNLPETIIQNTSHVFGSMLFSKALAYGFPKEIPNLGSVAQVVYGGSSLSFYYNELIRYTQGVGDYAQDFLNSTIANINGQCSEEAFTQVAYGMLDFYAIVQTLCSAANIENQYLPPEFQIQTISEKANQLSNLVITLLQAGDGYRIAHYSQQPTAEHEQLFAQTYKDLMALVGEISNDFNVLKAAIDEKFQSSFPEPAYMEFQQYAHSFTSCIASICILSLKIGQYAPQSLDILVQVLDKMSGLGFSIFNPLFTLLRFRGKFDEYIKLSKEAKEQIANFFTPLLQSLVQIQPTLPSAVQNLVNKEMVPLFETLQKLHLEYDKELEKLIIAMKQDRKFSVFQGVGQASVSELSEAAKGSIEVTGRILSQLLKTGAPIDEISENIQDLASEFNEFNAYVQIHLSHMTNEDEKIKLIHQRDTITGAMSEFADGFKLLTYSPDNALIKNKAGLLCANLLLSLCDLDSHPVITKQLGSSRQILTENVVRFFPANLKSLLEICTSLVNRSGEMPLETRQLFLGVYSFFMTTLRDCGNVFNNNSNSSNTQNVINCVKESDKLKSLLTALHSALDSPSLPQDLLATVGLLSVFANNVKGSAQEFRLSLQLSYRHAIESFTNYMVPFVEMVSSIATLQSDDYYQRFTNLKNIILSGIGKIQEKLKQPPPHGIYDQGFLLDIVSASKEVFKPSINLIQECQEILKLAPSPAQVKTAMNNISQTLTLIAQLMQYINCIDYEHELSLQSLLGFLLQKNIKEVEQKINNLVQCQDDPLKVSAAGTQLVSALYDFADSLDYNKDLKSVAGQVRLITNAINDTTAKLALGDASQKQVLNQYLQNVTNLMQQLSPIASKLIENVQAVGKAETDKAEEAERKKKEEEDRKKKEEEERIRKQQEAASAAEAAAAAEEEARARAEAEARAKAEEEERERLYGYDKSIIEHLPTEEEIEQMYIDSMSCNNNTMKPLLSSLLSNLKSDVDEFKRLYEDYRKDNNNKELLSQLETLASRIKATEEGIKKALNSSDEDVDEEVTPESILSMVNGLSQLNENERNTSIPEILTSLSRYAESNIKDPTVRSMIGALIGDIAKTSISNPQLGLMQMELLSQQLSSSNPQELAISELQNYKDKLKQNDFKQAGNYLNRSLFVDAISRILRGQVNPMTNSDSIQSQIQSLYLPKLLDGQIEEEEKIQLEKLINQLEDLIIGADETEDLDAEKISDKIMDLNSDIVSLGNDISSTLKKATPSNIKPILANVDLLKAKAINLANIAISSASKRTETDKDVSNDLQEEAIKLLEALSSYSDACEKISTSSNKNAQIRAINKANREINMCLGRIAELTDEIVEIPVSVLEPSLDDYNTRANSLLSDSLKLASLSFDSSSAKPIKFGKLMSSIQANIKTFRSSVEHVSQGTEEQEDLSGMLNELEGLFGKLTDAEALTYDDSTSAASLIKDICISVGEALNTEVVPQPKFANALPFRYTLPTIPPNKENLTIANIKPILDNKIVAAKNSLDSLALLLNNAKSSPEDISQKFKEFHDSISALIIPTNNLQTSTWNPQCQSSLLKAQNSLVNAGDVAIDATRSRLLGTDGWRETVSSFIAVAKAAFEQITNSADATIKAAENDLAVTNEVERELVNAARACQASQQRLLSLKNTAAEKKVTLGDSYVGGEIIDVSAPIINNAAKLIEIAQSQTKYVLSRDTEIINQKGLINTANNLVDSLELITVAAESVVNNEKDAFPKVLAGCNLISSAVAHFLVENNQKNGSPELNDALHKITNSIQELIKQLRSFGETAMDAANKKASSIAGSISGARKPLNSMIAKLNAEAKVVAARKALEEAERAAKQTRQGK